MYILRVKRRHSALGPETLQYRNVRLMQPASLEVLPRDRLAFIFACESGSSGQGADRMQMPSSGLAYTGVQFNE